MMKNKFGVLYSLIAGVLMIAFAMEIVGYLTNSITVALLIGVGLFLFSFIPREKGALYDSMNPDLTALTAYIGRYRKEIYTKFLNQLTIFDDVTGWFGIKDKEKLLNLRIEGEPEPYSGIFQPDNGDIHWGDQDLIVEKFQRDFQINPDKYRNSYFSYRRKAGEGANNLSIPFAEFTMDQVIKKLAADLNDITVWWGLGKGAFPLFNPASTYAVGTYLSFVVGNKVKYFQVVTATAAGESPATHPAKFKKASAKAIAKGLGTIIREGRVSGDLSNIASTGPITQADAYGQFKEVWYRSPEWLRQQGGALYTSFNNYEKLMNSFESISKYTEKDGTLKYLPLTNAKCLLKPVSWLSGSDQLTVSADNNLIAATDQLRDLKDIRAIEQMYHVDFSMTGVIGFGVVDFDAMSTNDQS